MKTAAKTKTKMMNGLFLADGDLTLRSDLPVPEPGPGEALIRVSLAGICTTDLELVKGYAGGFTGVLGHEFVGIVEQCPDDVAWVGERVVGNINLGCQSCQVCLSEGAEHCPDRVVMGIMGKDGVFAQYVTLPLANLHSVSASISDERAVFTEPLAAALRIPEQISLPKGARIAVVGPGRLGMLIGKVLSLHGGDVTMFGRSRDSLKLAAAWGLKTEVIENAPESAFDVTVEATGNPDGLKISLALVRPLGTLVLKSTFVDKNAFDLTKIVVDEINVVGSRCGPFDQTLHLLHKKLVPVTDLIDGRYPLEEGLQAIKRAGQRGVRKILLQIEVPT